MKACCRLCLLVWLLLVPNAALARVQRFALLVGNNQGSSGDAQLRYAEDDASKVAQVLRDLGSFEPADMLLLRGEDANTVRSSLISLNDRVRAAQGLPGQRALLFVYYSGHADAQTLHLGSSHFDLRELAQLVRGSAAAFRLLVVDACRSGALTRLKGGKLVDPFELNVENSLPGEGMAFLTASAEHEDAQESDEAHGSFFTNAFVSGLLGAADRDQDGAVVLEEAYSYARDATVRATSRTFAGPQHPSFQYELRGQDSLVLTQPGLAKTNRGQLLFPRGMSFLIMAQGPEGPVVGEVEAAPAARVLSLRPGRYFLRGRANDYFVEGEVSVLAGTTSAVKPDTFNRIRFAPLVRKGLGATSFAHRIELGASARTALRNGDQPCWGGELGYRLELRSFSLGARLGACRSGFENEAVTATTDEYLAAVEALRVWDFTPVSAFFGLGAGGTIIRQTFETRGRAPARASASPLWFLSAGATLPVTVRCFVELEAHAELQLLKLQETSFDEAKLRWAFAPRFTLSAGWQL